MLAGFHSIVETFSPLHSKLKLHPKSHHTSCPDRTGDPMKIRLAGWIHTSSSYRNHNWQLERELSWAALCMALPSCK